MPLRPFPLPYGIGVDVTSISRFSKYAIGSRESLNKFVQKVFTAPEQRVFWHKHRAWHAQAGQEYGTAIIPEVSGASCARYLASRWSAKEAIIKAYATRRRLMMHDIEIYPVQGRGPLAIVLDHDLETRSSASEASDSLSTDGNDSTQTVRAKERAIWQVQSTELDKDYHDRSRDTDGQVVRLSISHDGDVCVATALAPLDDVEGDVGGEATARDIFA